MLSYGGGCSRTAADPRFDKLATAVAGALLSCPIVKHMVGIYELTEASSKSLRKKLSLGGIEGSVILYPGGIAEIFQCSDTQEALVLNSRKGFIKLALTTASKYHTYDRLCDVLYKLCRAVLCYD